MKTNRKLSRRSFLGRVVGGAVAGGGALMAFGGTAQAQTDNDTGSNADPIGRGRGSGVTDNDRGSNADRAGNGRGARRRSCSDNDRGSNADPAGRGRGTGRSDSDPSDPVNCARR